MYSTINKNKTQKKTTTIKAPHEVSSIELFILVGILGLIILISVSNSAPSALSVFNFLICISIISLYMFCLIKSIIYMKDIGLRDIGIILGVFFPFLNIIISGIVWKIVKSIESIKTNRMV